MMMKIYVSLALFLIAGDLKTLQGQTVTILYTNNNNGNISYCDCGDEPKGGLPRRKKLFDQIRDKEKNVLTVDAGDFLNAFGFNRKQDSITIKIYEKLSYDAINIGEQEFSNGFEFFYKQFINSSLPLLSSTIYFKDSLITKPYLIKTIHAIRFGIIGFTPQSSFRYLPNKHLLPITIINEKEKLQSAIFNLKSKADVILVLSQAGYEEDIQLAKSVTGIDIIIGGHTQMEINENFQAGKTIIAQAGGNGEWVGVLKINYKNNQIQSFENTLSPLDTKVGEDAAIKNIVEKYYNQK
jgi:5'-nucleotidase / UDP-sugar diphosphatase